MQCMCDVSVIIKGIVIAMPPVFKALINNYIHVNGWSVITHLWPKLNGSLVELQFKLAYGLT